MVSNTCASAYRPHLAVGAVRLPQLGPVPHEPDARLPLVCVDHGEAPVVGDGGPGLGLELVRAVRVAAGVARGVHGVHPAVLAVSHWVQ